ncbi:unnamed protein product [Brassicogethes aeneus]|uniref:Uncharacterized protein n=1 Tax=Brassicogethes aeneus TaxID=1431903 RepID=A0A9P0BEE7_BRAAE|nr:unnamed protein product [Brassicogethes aeneus]
MDDSSSSDNLRRNMRRDVGTGCCPSSSSSMRGNKKCKETKEKEHCDCCLCNKKVKASFALAWVADTEGTCTLPQGFQFDYIDTMDKVEKKRKEFEDWMKKAPIADCMNLVMQEGTGKFSVANGIDTDSCNCGGDEVSSLFKKKCSVPQPTWCWNPQTYSWSMVNNNGGSGFC